VALKDIAEHKALNVADLKREVTGALDLNNKVNDDIRLLDGQYGLTKDDKRNLIL